MIGAELANLTQGEHPKPVDGTQGIEKLASNGADGAKTPPQMTAGEAAEAMNVSRSAVQSAADRRCCERDEVRAAASMPARG